MSSTTLQRIAPDGSRLSDRIARQLLHEIIAGEIKPDEPLSEARLAARFAASRAPVRDALQQLEKEGVVEIIPRVGVRVQGFTAEDASDLYDLRMALECHAVHRLKPSDEVMAELEEILARLRSAVWSGDVPQAIDCDLSLHEAICRLAGNRWLLISWVALRKRARSLYLFMVGRLQTRLDHLADSHEAILLALREGNVDLAAQRVAQHIDATRLQLVGLLRESKSQERGDQT